MNRFLNIFFLGYVILWPLFFNFILPIDGAGRIYMLIAAFMMLFNLPHRKFIEVFKEPIVWIWFLWILYTIINWFRAGYKPNGDISTWSFIFMYLIMPWLSMYVAIYESRIRPKLLLKNLNLFFFIYVLFGFLFQINSSGGDERGGNILGNTLPLVSLCLVFMSCLLYNLKLRRMPFLITSIILSTLCIMMVATRKAFAGELLILSAFIYSNVKKINAKNIIGLILAGFALYFSVTYILNNSMLGERFMNISEHAEIYNKSESRLLSLLGDRAYFYITGWDLFKQNPLCGIGINNYMAVTLYPMPIHSEYMVQLTENGIIGVILFVLFVIKFGSRIASVTNSKMRRMLNGWLICILFISFTSWIYDMPQYYIIYGVVAGLAYRESKGCIA